jgi:uncharacterized protein (TIGR02996 family)
MPLPPPRPQVLAFLDEIKATPDDDGPRLVLADWLDEHGDDTDRGRAELIRLQCQLIRHEASDSEKAGGMRLRIAVLLGQHMEAWLGPFRSPCRSYDLDRGLALFQFRANNLANRTANVVARSEYGGWFEGLGLYELWVNEAQRIASFPLLSSLLYLDLATPRPQAGATLALLSSPHLVRLIGLDASGARLGQKRLSALAKAPSFSRLTSLMLRSNALGADAATLLARLPQFANLRSLDLGLNNIGLPGLSALVSSPHLRNLTGLGLSDTGIGADGLDLLLAWPLLERVTFLRLGGLGLGDAEVAALARCPRLANLMFLDLSENAIGDDGAAALAGSPYLGNLRTLFISNNRIGEAGAQALLRSTSLPRLNAIVPWSDSLNNATSCQLIVRFGEYRPGYPPPVYLGGMRE